MELRILKISKTATFSHEKKSFIIERPLLGNLEISVDQLFDDYDIIIVEHELIHNKKMLIDGILKIHNFIRCSDSNYSYYGVNNFYINNKLKKCTYWSSIFTRVSSYHYLGGGVTFGFDQEDYRYIFFEDKLPCIFFDYRGDKNYLKEYYKITEVKYSIYYMEKKGSLTKAAINK
ncbi:hypothetical protein Hokovirus_2_25 [Hokovirus HKV1]|uniref:Uncharacterized protein n=1 Tax=Hokovirus HKV1 TaxID=1977638 RepID=A0A1V0SFU3_9VIRU|nr:hypothetical protein Hokovirus_2_25 [Hokovirus HKV1]